MNRYGQQGYAMVALLVALSVMAIMMTVAMPVWKQMAQREKEAELIFRGQQYAHAIGLFQRKAGPGVYPPNIDVLVEQRYLRKKYKDPITGQDFQPLPAVQTGTPGQTAGQGGTTGTGQTASAAAGLRQSLDAMSSRGPQGQGTSTANGTIPGGVAGVASKSAEPSIRVYNGRTHYNEWEFRFIAAAPAGPGGGNPQRGGTGQPPGRGAPPAPPTRGTPFNPPPPR